MLSIFEVQRRMILPKSGSVNVRLVPVGGLVSDRAVFLVVNLAMSDLSYFLVQSLRAKACPMPWDESGWNQQDSLLWHLVSRA